ncbi:MAG TPA: CRISPR-associated protein, partial [Acidobacteria bacterium]|nr:CRISPR-associated protein [Acidobacteriota bacterium]
MFQTLQNTVKIEFRIIPDGPLLVRAQAVGLDPGVADMEFQRTHRNGRSTVFLAGSGLKGV